MVFGGFQKEDSPFVVLGIPLESDPSFREGARWGPLEIRKASNFIEFRSELSGKDADEVGFYDVGDLPVLGRDKEKTLDIIYHEVRGLDRVPVALGGEHTITYALVKATEPDCLLVFDAHLDARDEYLGDKWSHACWLRRLLEETDLRVAVVGARAYVDEEVEFLKGRALFSKSLKGMLARYFGNCEKLYVSLDMDYFDPSAVPGVSNPEPGGASFEDFLDHLAEVARYPLAGFDVVELSPIYDSSGVSAVYAARAIVEVATSLRPLSRVLLSP